MFCLSLLKKPFSRGSSTSTTTPKDTKSPKDSSLSTTTVTSQQSSQASTIRPDTGPVTIKPSSHGANAVTAFRMQGAKNAFEALPKTSQQRCKELLQCSLDFKDNTTEPVSVAKNGFVNAVVEAYSQHHHLQIRPEDVWLAILTQFSAYVNAHAEELRGKFVAHKGKKELRIDYDAPSRYAFDFGIFAKDMSDLLEKNVVDPELREWMIPSFSTTTRHDVVVASVVMMASMQKYFKYVCGICCGIPTVKLCGKRSDWEKILAKLDKLKTFGKEPKIFHDLLKPVITRFVRSFDEPSSPDIINFWSLIVKENIMGSGTNFYSGWITAFCFWDEDGKCLYRDWATSMPESLKMDGVGYHTVDTDCIPPGWVTVPVTVDDHGDIIETTMVAGSVGIQSSSSGQRSLKGDAILDTMAPQLGWWIFEHNDKKDVPMNDYM